MTTEFFTIRQSQQSIRQGELTPRELLEHCLARIRRFESTLRAWVMVDEEGARQTADRLTESAKRGEFVGPLHGIPVGIKDLIDVVGWPTLAGSPLREGHRADVDSPLVATLRKAGAIILGKTVTVEFAAFDPPPTRNPWEPTGHTPGGSSSGSAAAVAAGMCLGALGTQTGGSLVRPSAYCGVATCKPTFGQLSTDGVVPLSYHLDHPGPIARSVDDLQLLMESLAGAAALEGDLHSDPTAPPRLGLIHDFFVEGSDALVRDAFGKAVERLRAGGAEVHTVSLPLDFDEVLALHSRIMAVEAAAYHRESFTAHRSQYGPLLAGLLDEGLILSGVDYAAALAHQREWRRSVGAWFDGFDALVMPSTDTTAPATLATTGYKRNQAPWSYLGVPVISIPCGLAADHMPVGLQIVQRPHAEGHLIRVARWCERAIAFHETPPLE